MPTYTQLQAESWWGREVITAEMDWLGDELCRRTNRPAAAAGTKGDNYHDYGAHRSQEWILNSRYCTSRTYTVQSGLTATQARHIAGFDFTPGSVEQMIAQSRRLMAAMKAGLLDEVREIYCNVDGDQVVDGWDNVRNRAVSSDSSHLWHWHLTLDRRHCTNRTLMERIVAIALGDTLEDDMTPAQFLALLRDPAVATEMRRLPWQYVGNPLPAGQTVLGVLAETHAAGKALAGKDMTDEPAIIAGVLAGLSAEAIAAAIPTDIAGQVAAELAARLQE